MRLPRSYGRNVFINAPFGKGREEMLRAIIFPVIACGYNPRCALELAECAVDRMQTIVALIRECRYSVHDLSFAGLDAESGLPCFNMPFELGLFLGARRFGDRSQKRKRCLIMDSERYRYQAFLSDLAGHHIACHGGTAEGAVREISRWLAPTPRYPLGVCDCYRDFMLGFEELSRRVVEDGDPRYGEYVFLVRRWLFHRGWPAGPWSGAGR